MHVEVQFSFKCSSNIYVIRKIKLYKLDKGRKPISGSNNIALIDANLYKTNKKQPHRSIFIDFYKICLDQFPVLCMLCFICILQFARDVIHNTPVTGPNKSLETPKAYCACTYFMRQNLKEKQLKWLHRQQVIVCEAMCLKAICSCLWGGYSVPTDDLY